MKSLVLLLALIASTSSLARSITPQLPLVVPSQELLPLDEQVDASLQASLETRLNSNPLWRRLIANNKMAVGLVDLRDPRLPRFARVNGDTMMYAASLPKLAVLFAASKALADGALPDTAAVRSDMRQMMSRSDNDAATRLIDKLGFARIEAALTDERYGFYNANAGGGMWVGKRYAKTGLRLGDPLKNISHGATVTQVSRMYYLLAMGNLVSYEESKRMLSCLVDPELHHKFVKTLDRVARNSKIYRKSGTWEHWHSDSALVWGPDWRRYIVVGLIDDPRGEQILRDLIYVVEKTLREREK